MKLWSRKPPPPPYRICSQCGVLFDPRRYEQERFADLCEPHASDQRMLAHRRDPVMEYAYRNWEKLEKDSRKFWDEPPQTYERMARYERQAFGGDDIFGHWRKAR